jgi:Bacteriophage Mu Gp45 spike protein
MPTQADNCIIRCAVAQTNDKDDQQTMQIRGRVDEIMGSMQNGIPRVQNYGYTSFVPAGSIGQTVTPDGNNDKSMCHGLEHAQSRFRNLTEGQCAEYDKWGHRRLKEQGQWTDKVGSAFVQMKESGGIVHINPPSLVVLAEIPHCTRDAGPIIEEELNWMRADEERAEAERTRIKQEAQARFASLENAKEERLLRMEARILELETINQKLEERLAKIETFLVI